MQLLLFPGSQYVGNLVCAPQMWSLFPPSCGVPALKPCWPSESCALEVPPSSARTPGWGADVGLGTLKRTGGILQYDFFQVCGSLIWWEWDLIVVKVAFLPSHCSCFFVFECLKKKKFFGRLQSFLLLLVQQLVILVFSREEVSSTAATPPSFLESRGCLWFGCLLPLTPVFSGHNPLYTGCTGTAALAYFWDREMLRVLLQRMTRNCLVHFPSSMSLFLPFFP